MERPLKDDDYTPIGVLIEKLGYIDPCPELGKCNKKARKMRSDTFKPIAKELKKYSNGTIQEDDGGAYYKVGTYFYKGVWYA